MPINKIECMPINKIAFDVRQPGRPPSSAFLLL